MSNNRVCGQCNYFEAGQCYGHPPTPTPSGHMLRPRVDVNTKACGTFRPLNGSATVGVMATASVAPATPEEARRIAADMEARGELTVDRTPPPKYAPPGKKKAAQQARATA
jgi:hypothetical protein